MNRFAALLDRLGYEPRRNAKLRLLTEFFRTTPDPERGWALAAMTDALSFKAAKPNVVRDLVTSRVDGTLFALSYDFVGDLSETTALIWPAPEGGPEAAPPTLTDVVAGLEAASRPELPRLLAGWLDALDETGRWALVKLVTGNLRIGVSARLAKTAVAALGGREADEVELVWPGLEAPYTGLFAWVEGRGPRPEASDPAPFRPPMLAHPIEDEVGKLDPAEFVAEWKWDGIRVQLSAGTREDGTRSVRLWSRAGEEVSKAFPDLTEAMTLDGTLDGELLVLREGRVQSFNVLQQRLNRAAVTAKMLAEFPAGLRAYDLLTEGGEDLRHLPWHERRVRLERFVARLASPRVDLSTLVPFTTWDELERARTDPASAGGGPDADAIEGCMAKRRDGPYVPGRPKGEWFKWKRAPHLVDAVMMYAQRGSGRRSSYYSDYTFGVWRAGEERDELVPVGKAYSGFTDAELVELDRFVRNNTVSRFGPVREVSHGANSGLVLEVAFEGLQRSTRHKSGLAMRFPRVARIRWDKPASQADRLETLEAMLAREGEAGGASYLEEAEAERAAARQAGTPAPSGAPSS